MLEWDTTLSPTLMPVTSSPTAITSPAASEPETCGSGFQTVGLQAETTTPDRKFSLKIFLRG